MSTQLLPQMSSERKSTSSIGASGMRAPKAPFEQIWKPGFAFFSSDAYFFKCLRNSSRLNARHSCQLGSPGLRGAVSIPVSALNCARTAGE